MRPLLLALAIAGCATPSPADPASRFFANLQALCGRAYEGRMVSDDAADASFRGQRLVMQVRDCSAQDVRIPFAVGEDRSRTWVVTRTASGLRLKHDHRHEDGTPDRRTNYGGDSRPGGTAEQQAFPADEESMALFVADGIPQSAANVWALELRPGAVFAYELTRPGRRFRVEFDLARPLVGGESAGQARSSASDTFAG